MTLNRFPPVTRLAARSVSGRSRSWFGAIALGTFSAALTALPTLAAEKIYFVFGPVKQSLAVSSLANFAKTGTPDPELANYLRLAKADNPQTQQRFQTVLLRRFELNPNQLSQFFNSAVGSQLLSNFGRYVQDAAGNNGQALLQTGLIQAAASPTGLTLLNVLEKMPADIQIDLQSSFQLTQAGKRVARATERGIDIMGQLAATETTKEPTVDYTQLPDLRQPGAFSPASYRWELNDSSRKRQFYVMIHRPRTLPTGRTPVVILSHGLGEDPGYYARAAQHLATYGFVVALPQHPGSDAAHSQRFWQGATKEVFLLSEFSDRPKDISYVIDELERRNASEFGGTLDLKAVGVGGHSFGGYTSLAVAGATIDFANLEKECNSQYGFLNTSLLLQCQALKLPRQTYNFRDLRVIAVNAFNPVNSAIFGPTGLAQLKIPVLIAGGGYDPATPFVFEQMRSFAWLTTPTKYLAMVESQAHIDVASLDAGISRLLQAIPDLVLVQQQLIDSYARGLGVAFWGTQVLKDPKYQPYLQSAYATYLSQNQPKANQLLLITSLMQKELEQAVQQFRQEEEIKEGETLTGK